MANDRHDTIRPLPLLRIEDVMHDVFRGDLARNLYSAAPTTVQSDGTGQAQPYATGGFVHTPMPASISVRTEMLPVPIEQQEEIVRAIQSNIYRGVYSTGPLAYRDSATQIRPQQQPAPEIRSIGKSERLIKLDDEQA